MKKLVCVLLAAAFVAACGQKPAEKPELKKTKETIVCDTEENNCSVTCESGCCLAIYWPDTGECDTSCDCKKFPPVLGKNAGLKNTSKVTVTAKNVELSRLALALDRVKGHKVYVPADKSGKRVSVSMKNVSLEKTLKSMGLVSLPEEKAGK